MKTKNNQLISEDLVRWSHLAKIKSPLHLKTNCDGDFNRELTDKFVAELCSAIILTCFVKLLLIVQVILLANHNTGDVKN